MGILARCCCVHQFKTYSVTFRNKSALHKDNGLKANKNLYWVLAGLSFLQIYKG